MLDDFRKQIDEIDHKICALLAERFRVTKNVGEYKAEHNLPPMDTEREKAQEERFRAYATDYDLDPDALVAIFQSIIIEVKKEHRAIREARDTNA